MDRVRDQSTGDNCFLSFFCGSEIAVSTGVSAMSHEGIELVVRCDMCHGLQR